MKGNYLRKTLSIRSMIRHESIVRRLGTEASLYLLVRKVFRTAHLLSSIGSIITCPHCTFVVIYWVNHNMSTLHICCHLLGQS